MTLKSQMATDVTSLFLNTDEHAETFIYTPKGGNSRSITLAIVAQRIRFENNQHDKTRVRELELLASRDETTGIINPQPGDQLTQDSDAREPKIPLMFIDVVAQDSSCLTLLYHESPKRTRTHSNNSHMH